MSHASVLEERDNLSSPADLYLEGSDQHRGWFQTSLLTSVGTRGRAPYKELLTHGFVNDGSGKKMSKSVGNVVSPESITKTYGADILRLWCASVDYRDDVKISENILKQSSEAYRRVRNTARYILGNIIDFDPVKDRVEYSEMVEIDRWAVHKLEELKQKVTANYEKYEFYNLFHDIHYFTGIDMSAFYLDIIKDRLYVTSTNSLERRSAQTVMYDILISLVKMISPILSFTAEEIWSYLPEDSRDAESVLLTKWIELDDNNLDSELATKWEKIGKLRGEVNKVLEVARRDKVIGHSLNAEVVLYSSDESYMEFMKTEFDKLEDIFIVSKVSLSDSATDLTESSEIAGLFVGALKAKGEKCERCWKYSEELGTDEKYVDACPRCTEVLKAGE